MTLTLRGRRNGGNRGNGRINHGQRPLTETKIIELIRGTVTEIFKQQVQPAQSEQRPAPADRRSVNPNTNNGRYPPRSNYSGARPTTEPSTTAHSTNADFAQSVRTSFHYVKIQHAVDNWTNLPKSIDHAINKLIDNIKPPSPTDVLKQQLVEAADAFKSNITAVVQDHLEKMAAGIKTKVQTFNQLDRPMIHDTVRRQLQRPVNKRVRQATIDRALGDLSALPVRETGQWFTVSGGRRQPSLADVEFDDTEDELDNLVDAVRRADTEPTTSASSKRPLLPSPSALPPSKMPTVENRERAAGPRKQLPNPLILAPESRDWWALPATLPPRVKILIIADSNGSGWNTPDHMQVVALRGGRIGDAARLLNAYRAPPSIQGIVLAVGTNNRRDGNEILTSELTQVEAAVNNITIPCRFLEIPNHPNASPQERDGADFANNTARDLFGDRFIKLDGIVIRSTNNPSDRSHYNQQSADEVVTRLTSTVPAETLN